MIARPSDTKSLGRGFRSAAAAMDLPRNLPGRVDNVDMPRDQARAIEWQHLTREEFERWVNALVVRKYRDDPEMHAYAVDGRGGDDGVDVAVARGDEIISVYQLKFYPEGMSGGHGGRRQKVKGSFERAAKITTMTDWYLVTPGDITLKERQVFSAYRRGTDVRIHFIGRADLDGMLAEYPEILRMATYNPVVKALRDAGHEKDALVGPDDLAERVRALGELSDSRDEYWAEKFSYRDNTVVSELVAKRPDSAQKSPIRINMTTAFGPEHEGLRASFQQAMDFGALSPIVLPPEVVTAFEIDGPAWLRRTEGPTHVEMRPIPPHLTLRCEIRVVSRSGATRASLQGTITSVAGGRRGMTFSSEFLDALTLKFRLPDPAGEERQGGLEVSVHVEETSASNALRVLRFADLMAAGESLQMVVADAQVFKTGTFTPNRGEHKSDEAYLEVADDLSFLEHEFGLTFAMPQSISPSERAQIRMARMLTEGKCVVFFGADQLTATINLLPDPPADAAEALKSMLEGAPFQHLSTVEPWQMDVMGQTLEFGTLQVWHPSVALDDADTVRRALEIGTEDVPIAVRPTDSSGFRVMIVERGPDTRTFAPEPLNLFGLPEPEGFPVDPANAPSAVRPTEQAKEQR